MVALDYFSDVCWILSCTNNPLRAFGSFCSSNCRSELQADQFNSEALLCTV